MPHCPRSGSILPHRLDPAGLCRAIPCSGSTLPHAGILSLPLYSAYSLAEQAACLLDPRDKPEPGVLARRRAGFRSALADLVPTVTLKTSVPPLPACLVWDGEGCSVGTACCTQGWEQPVTANAVLQSAYKCLGQQEGWGGGRHRRQQRRGGDAGRRLLCVLILPGECLRVSGMQIRSCTALLRNLATGLSRVTA